MIPDGTHVRETIKEGIEQEITVGNVITLVSDPDVVGAVTGIEGNKYKVLIGSSVQTYFREQIQLQEDNNDSIESSLARVRTMLTAYQISNPGTSNLYSLNAARIDFVPYQFRPALKMIRSDSPRILIADDVGVGKTIEAGLIMKEMEARSNLSSVLIICPRPLVAERKWLLEMKRFDEDFTQLDGSLFAACISDMDRDGVWPERYSKVIVPYSLFNEVSITGADASSKRRYRGKGLDALDPLPHFDLVIVDEAHNIRNANTWGYKGVELFCRNADAVVFMTATPLQNSNDDLYTLLNLLRPDVVIDKHTFETMAEPNVHINKFLHMVRNKTELWQESAKRELAQILQTDWGRNVIQNNPVFERIERMLDKESVSRDERIELIRWTEELHSFHSMINRTRRKDIDDFCVRRTETVEVSFHPVQQKLYDRLIQFEAAALERLHGLVNVRFMMCMLMRQASSCIHALVPYVDDLIYRRTTQIHAGEEWYDVDSAFDDHEDQSLQALAVEIRSLLTLLPEDDPKFECLLEILQEKQRMDNNRVIVFSTFRHTLSYLQKRLAAHGLRVGQADGSINDVERYRLRERFQMERSAPEAIDVLLFSEIGCEGLDYQFCDTMINYDLPWNPMRIEQRIGRIDRRGQASDTVKIYNIITSGTIDAAIYERCLSKIGVFEASIGDCSEILGSINKQISKIMFDVKLSEKERQQKIEQMADNEVLKVQELRRLEEDEKTLFGFDLSPYVVDKEVQNAKNMWLSPPCLHDLVIAYLNDRLGEGEYVLGKKAEKSLRLGEDKRRMLYDDFSKLSFHGNNAAARIWKAYLKSNRSVLSMTFDSAYAKDHRNIVFLTQMHPLLVQAAEHQSKDFPQHVSCHITHPEIPTGVYTFLIYAWRYTGRRPDIRLIVVSDEPVIEANILSYLSSAEDAPVSAVYPDDDWREMEDLHHIRWQEAKRIYVDTEEKECRYQRERLEETHRQQRAVICDQIAASSEENIRRMREGQLANLTRRYENQAAKLDASLRAVDIHTTLLVRGVLHVEAVGTERDHGED